MAVICVRSPTPSPPCRPQQCLDLGDGDYDHTKSCKPIDDELIKKLADEAEAGYDVDEIIARRGTRGRPRLGSAPSTVESVRLDPELN